MPTHNTMHWRKRQYYGNFFDNLFFLLTRNTYNTRLGRTRGVYIKLFKCKYRAHNWNYYIATKFLLPTRHALYFLFFFYIRSIECECKKWYFRTAILTALVRRILQAEFILRRDLIIYYNDITHIRALQLWFEDTP